MVDIDLDPLFEVAGTYCERAWVPRVYSRRVRVGAAVRANDGSIYGGCNVQQRFHSHDIHAEVNAITTMLSEGRDRMTAIAVVSDVADLTPCGSCLDWILQLGGDDCVVGWRTIYDDAVEIQRAGDMMPFHPPYGASDDGAPTV